MDRATRSAVRWRVPVSVVGTFGFGTRWTLARAMRLASAARMMAPSILASSDSRCGLNSASSRKPPEQIRAPRGRRRPRSAPPCWPAGCDPARPAAGAPGRSHRAPRSWRPGGVPAPRETTRQASRSLRAVSPPVRGRRPRPAAAVRAGGVASQVDVQGVGQGGDPSQGQWTFLGPRVGHQGPGEAEPGRLGQAAGRVGSPGGPRRRGRPPRARPGRRRTGRPVAAEARARQTARSAPGR